MTISDLRPAIFERNPALGYRFRPCDAKLCTFLNKVALPREFYGRRKVSVDVAN